MQNIQRVLESRRVTSLVYSGVSSKVIRRRTCHACAYRPLSVYHCYSHYLHYLSLFHSPDHQIFPTTDRYYSRDRLSFADSFTNQSIYSLRSSLPAHSTACCKARINRKIEYSTPCKIVTPENFNSKLCTQDLSIVRDKD